MRWLVLVFLGTVLGMTVVVHPGERLVVSGFQDINCDVPGTHTGGKFFLHNDTGEDVHCDITPAEGGEVWKEIVDEVQEAIDRCGFTWVVVGEAELKVDAQEEGAVIFEGKSGSVEVRVGISKTSAETVEDMDLWGNYYILEPDPVIVWVVKNGETAGFTVKSGSIELTDFSVRLAGCDMVISVYSPKEGEKFGTSGELAAVPVRFSVVVSGEKAYVPNVSVFLDSSPVDVDYDPATRRYTGVANGGPGEHRVKITARIGECSAEEEVGIYIEGRSSIPEDPWVMACLAVLLLSGLSWSARRS